MNESQLRDLMERTAPVSPSLSPAERTAAVVRRGRAARRRARVLVAGAAVAVLAATVVGPLSRAGDTDQVVDRSDRLPAAYAAAACPAEPVDISGASTVAALPPGAISVRLCPAATDGTGPTWSPERTALVGPQVDPFLADLASMSEYAAPVRCQDAEPRPWALRVTYPDRTETVGAPVSSCSSVRLGDTDVDVAQLVGYFFDHMTEQRTGRYGPAVPEHDFPPPACDETYPDTWDGFAHSIVLANARGGRICSDGVDTELTIAEVRLLSDDFWDPQGLRAERVRADCGPPAPARRVIVVDPWGDVVTWSDAGCPGVFGSSAGTWVPRAEAAAVIDDALSR